MEPSVGKINAAMILNKNITEIDCAISSSFAPITGAVAAIAEPPHIDEPTPIKVAILGCIFKALYKTKDTISDIEIVDKIIGND